MTTSGPHDSVVSAVARALAKQHDDATREVEAILDAALRVAERVAPSAPRVADIVAEAKTSNQAFYRYFSGKDELMDAVMERGVHRVATYLTHQMSKESEPLEQIAAWIRGVLTQVTDRTAARQGAAVSLQLSRSEIDHEPPAGLGHLGDILLVPVREAGSRSPELDTQVIQEAILGTMRRHVSRSTAPDKVERDHIVEFCLRGLSR